MIYLKHVKTNMMYMCPETTFIEFMKTFQKDRNYSTGLDLPVMVRLADTYLDLGCSISVVNIDEYTYIDLDTGYESNLLEYKTI